MLIQHEAVDGHFSDTAIFLLNEKRFFFVSVFSLSDNRLFRSSPYYEWWQGSKWITQVHLGGVEEGGDPECWVQAGWGLLIAAAAGEMCDGRDSTSLAMRSA